MFNAKSRNVFYVTALAVIMMFFMFFSGCYDLGDFKDTAAYYETFNKANLVDQTLVKTEYSIQDCFYNNETIDKNKCFIEEAEYIYFATQTSKDLSFCAISLGVCSGVSKTLNASIFVFDNLDAFVDFERDIEDYLIQHPEEYGYLEEDAFLPVGTKVAKKSLNLKPNVWDYIYVDPINYQLLKDQFIVVRFDNNSKFNCGKDQNIALKITNLLIEARFWLRWKMFEWFWEFLYSITKIILRLIDGLMDCANMICGIDPVLLDGNETDFLTYLLRSDTAIFAFKVAALLGMIVLVFFVIYAIIRSIVKEKPDGSPGQIAVKGLKCFLLFLFVPTIMIAAIWVGNTFMQALYTATLGGASSIGSFLFAEFAKDGGMAPDIAAKFASGELSYLSTSTVASYMDLNDFSYVFSWLAGGVILFSIAASMIVFIDRVISIVILFIVSPFSISTTVVDDGAHFKLWRDQVLVKFLTGYGMIIALNIYGMVVSLIVNPALVFFPGSGFLNFLMKLLLVAGGAFTLRKSMALIGNLVSAGAGSTELRDNAITAGGLFGRARSIVGAPFAPAASIIRDAVQLKSRDLGAKLLDKVGLGLGGPGGSSANGEDDKKSSSRNSNKVDYNSGANGSTNSIIKGGSGGGADSAKNKLPGGENKEKEKPHYNNNNIVNNAIYRNDGMFGGNRKWG